MNDGDPIIPQMTQFQNDVAKTCGIERDPGHFVIETQGNRFAIVGLRENAAVVSIGVIAFSHVDLWDALQEVREMLGEGP